MAGPYGSAFTGGYKRSPLAEAMANAGGLIGQGLQQGTENFVAGQEHQDQIDAQEKDRALREKQFVSTEVNRIEGEYNDAVANGGDPDEAARRRDEELAKIPGYTPPAQPQPRPQPAPSAAPTPPQAPSPERSPGAQMEAPDYEMGSLGAAPRPAGQPAPAAPERPPIAEAMNTPPPAPKPSKSFGQIQAEGKKKAEADKNYREAREGLSRAGYEGYVGRIPGLVSPEAINTLEDVNAAHARIVAYERDRANKRAELQAAAAQGNARASQLLAVMNAYDNDWEITAATTEINLAESALSLANQAERGDPTAQSSFRRVVAAMMNKGALSDADVRDVTGDSSMDSARKTIDRWIGGDEMALTKAQIASLKQILGTKRDLASKRLADRQVYFEANTAKIVPEWTPPKPPAPTGTKFRYRVTSPKGKVKEFSEGEFDMEAAKAKGFKVEKL